MQPTMPRTPAPTHVHQHILGSTPSLYNYFQQQHMYYRQHATPTYGASNFVNTQQHRPRTPTTAHGLAAAYQHARPAVSRGHSGQDNALRQPVAQLGLHAAQPMGNAPRTTPGNGHQNEQRKTTIHTKSTHERQGPSLTMRHPITGNRVEPTPKPAVSPEFEQMIANIQSDLQQAGDRFKAANEVVRKPTRKRKADAESSAQQKRRRVSDSHTSNTDIDHPVSCTPPPKRIRAPLTPEQKERKRAYNKAVRSSPDYRNAENKKRNEQHDITRHQKKNKDIEFYIENFQKKTSQGPIYICVSCDRLSYRHAVINGARLLGTNTPNVELCAIGPPSAEGKKWLCHTCNRYLKDGRVPPLALVNGNKFPEKPPHLDLHQLEWRLVAPRLVFMKIHQAPRGRQFKIEGNVVNVIADVANTVSKLPRRRNNTDTIPVKLKRNLLFKNHTLSQNVRPEKVREAAHWLTQNGPLFQKQGITFHNLLQQPSNTEEPPEARNLKRKLLDVQHMPKKKRRKVHEVTAAPQQTQEPVTQPMMNENEREQPINQKEKPSKDHDDGSGHACMEGCTAQEKDAESDSEDEAETAGATDTMLSQNTYIEPAEAEKVREFAPGSKSRPQSIFLDKFCEELAYPDIFLGHQRPTQRHTKISYPDIVKSELLQTDRRAATNVENIFFKTKKLQMKFLTGRTQLALRQHKTHDMTITAGDLKSGANIKKIIQHDQGYKFLATLRGSPPYFERAKRDIFAMIRQLGPATFFVSFSAAETRWNHLIKIIGLTVDKKAYTDEEVERMPWPEKSRLIQSDPVTCARHFDHTLRIFLGEFLKSGQAPIGELLDFFYRIEMQHRGSCHVHMLVWIAHAPMLETSEVKDIIKFIDKYITCAEPPENKPELKDLVSRQKHSHTTTCRPRPSAPCRFGYPQPPMPTTVLLEPLTKDEEGHRTHLEQWKKIRAKLDDRDRRVFSTFSEFLKDLDLSYTEYENAVRASLKAKTIFLRRAPDEITINNYNTDCLRAWRANMDIQFIVDAYACATYIVSYMSKGCRGMSKLLQRTCKEAAEGNNSLIEQMRHIGNKFLNAVEISAQEAAYIALQLSLRKGSRSTVHLNTAPPHERVRLLKSCHELEELADEDTNIDSSNILRRYSTRQADLEQTCLAEWAAWYDCSTSKPTEASDIIDVDGTPIETNTQHDEDNCEDVPLLQSCEMDEPRKRRKRARIIRCPWFNVTQAPEKHYRELVMLFIPWRNEEVDVLGGHSTYHEHYLEKKDAILVLLERYSPGRAAVEDAIETINAMEVEEIENTAVAPQAQNDNEEAETEENVTNDPTFVPAYDIGKDLDVQQKTLALESLQHNQIGSRDFRENVQRLNPEQRAFFDYINGCLQRDCNQLLLFLSGGAGVGKTLTTNTIYQQLLRIYNTTAGEDFDKMKILVMASTGKAAHLIHGSTIHSALSAPFKRIDENYIPMSISTLNTARAKLGHIKFVIIDEISMVGGNIFNFVNRRLQDIIGSIEPFGGCHMLCVGDMFQLKPVCDRWVFKNSDKGIAPLTPNLWRTHFQLYELKQVMRQREHFTFAELLNRLREGHQTDDDIEYLKTKEIKNDFRHPDYPHNQLTHLFNRNADVEEFNNAARKHDPTIIRAKDQISGGCGASMVEAHLNKLKAKKTSDTHGLATELLLALEDRIEICINIDVSDGLTNGASGRVMGLPGTTTANKSTANGFIWVLFDEPVIGRQARKKHHGLYTNQIPRTWTPIPPIKRQINLSAKTELHAIRIQFPIRCAAAKTIHRSQGQTLTSVVADFTATIGPHKHYVAISRVTDPNNLYITNLNDGAIKTDKDTEVEMERMRTLCRLDIPSPIRHYEPDNKYHILFFNISSLHKYCLDLAADYSFKNSHVACILETHLRKQTRIGAIKETHKHQVHLRPQRHWKNAAGKHGVSIFSKAELLYTKFYTTDTLEAISTNIAYPKKCSVIAVYRYHRTPPPQFFKDMQRIISESKYKRKFIGGDINLDFNNKGVANRIKKSLLQQNKLQQVIREATTKRNTIIDHIYTNIKHSPGTVIHPYYSDHHMIRTTIHTTDPTSM